MEANESMKNQVVELERQIDQGKRNHQAIIQDMEKNLKILGEKQEVHHTESLPHTTDSNPRHEFFYKSPSIRNENDKGDVEVIDPVILYYLKKGKNKIKI